MDIPDTVVLWCPLPPAINANWQRWERRTIAWMNSYSLDAEQREAGRLRGIVAGELAGRTIPGADDTAGAQFSTDSLMWLFAFDDAYCDEGRYSHDPASMAILAAEMGRTAETGHAVQSSPLALALADLRQRLTGLAGPVQIDRWVRAMKEYLSYQVWEAAFRSTGRVPTFDQYAVARIRSGSMEVCTMTLDIAAGYEVSAVELNRPMIRALSEMACALVGWDNDVASYFKEHERGDTRINLLDSIAHQYAIDPAQALPLAIAFRDVVLARFLQLSAEVTGLVAFHTRRYLDGLAAWIRGNLDWSANTARYRRAGSSTVAVSEVRTQPVWEGPLPPGIAWWWQPAAEDDCRNAQSPSNVLQNSDLEAPRKLPGR
ncbi:MAG: hypothetical protein JO345_25805 [Streptosporangiaceae bacterium]|nr:hypothetical protein [Streptosporangiaceae bacterium]